MSHRSQRPDPTRCEAAARRIDGLLVYTSLEKARALVAFSLGLTPAEQRGAEALRRRREERRLSGLSVDAEWRL